MPRHGAVARRPRPTQGTRAPHRLCGSTLGAKASAPTLALSEAEQTLVLQALCSERFADTAPAAVHATLLDEGSCLGSVRTMYRLLAANASSAERRRQRSHPAYAKPELLALAGAQPGLVVGHHQAPGAGQMDLLSPLVILDIFSRYVVGWLMAPRESAELAQQLRGTSRGDAGRAHAARRSRRVHALQVGGQFVA